MLVIKGVSLGVRHRGYTLKSYYTVILDMFLTPLSLTACSFPIGVVTPTYRVAVQIQSGARREAWGLAYGKHSVSGGCCY